MFCNEKNNYALIFSIPSVICVLGTRAYGVISIFFKLRFRFIKDTLIN